MSRIDAHLYLQGAIGTLDAATRTTDNEEVLTMVLTALTRATMAVAMSNLAIADAIESNGDKS